MRWLTDVQRKELESTPDGFAPEFHPVRDLWFKVIDTLVCVITFGYGRVVPRESHRRPIKWNGVMK